MQTRLRAPVTLTVIALALFSPRGAAAQEQNALSARVVSDSTSPVTRRADRVRSSITTRVDDPATPRSSAVPKARVVLAPVTVSGKPGSLEVVGVPIPKAFAMVDSVRYRVIPVSGARVIGRTEGLMPAPSSRQASLMLTVAAPSASSTGRIRVASAEFDGPAGTQPVEVPIEMTVLATRRVEVTIVDQLVGARRGDIATIRYRVVNFGNVTDSVRFTAEVPTGWKLNGGTPPALGIRAAADGALRLWVSPQAAPGTSMVRIVAISGGAIVSATDVRVEVENPSGFASDHGPRLTISSAFTGLAGGATTTAYMATLEGQLADSVSVAATGAWRPGTAPTSYATDLALMRLGVPMTPPSISLISPTVQLGAGLIGGSLSDLTGTFVNGSGVSLGTRLGSWKISGLSARPYTYGYVPVGDTASRGVVQSARVERDFGDATVFVSTAHLANPAEGRTLDATSFGSRFDGGALDGLSTELGYRRAGTVTGLGWSTELRRQGDDGAFSLRAMHAPGGAKAYARATDDLAFAASRRLADWANVSGSYWTSGDHSGTIGSANGSGWNAGPTISLRSLGTNITLQARNSTLEVASAAGRFGSDETQASAMVDIRQRGVFLNVSGSVGAVSRSIASGDEPMPSLSGASSDLRGSLGTALAMGTVQLDASTQQYSGPMGIMPRRSTFAMRANRLALPVSDRKRVYVSADLERMAFAFGDVSPWTRRMSLSAPIGFGIDITAVAEQNPFMSMGGGGWMTAIRIDKSRFLPRPVTSGESRTVYRDLNGNGVRDKHEIGFAGLVIRCGERALVTDRDGHFKCGVGERSYVEPRSVPAGWLAPGIRRDQEATRDIALIAITAVQLQIDLIDVDTIRVPRAELSKLVVVARDSAGSPWFARDLTDGKFVLDALPPGRYTVDVDVSGVEEPLRMHGRAEFVVGTGVIEKVHVPLTGRSVKVRSLPPTQSNGAAGSADAPAKSAGSSGSSRSSSSKENQR